jgi:hypothetical protein
MKTKNYYVRVSNDNWKNQIKFNNKKKAIQFAKQLSKEKKSIVDLYISDMNYLRLSWFEKEKLIYQYSATGNWFLVDNRNLKPTY